MPEQRDLTLGLKYSWTWKVETGPESILMSHNWKGEKERGEVARNMSQRKKTFKNKKFSEEKARKMSDYKELKPENC